jgi:hypothetical protein
MTPQELGQQPINVNGPNDGLTLRQHLTIEAYRSGQCPYRGDTSMIADWCVKQADAFLNSLARGA